MSTRYLIALSFVFLSTMCSIAQADDCDTIISDKLLNRDDVKNENEEELSIISDICSSTFEEYSSKKSKSASARYKLISGKFGSSREEFSQKQSEYCSNYSDEQHRKQSFFRAQQALSDKAIEAWVQCKQANSELACWASSSGSNKRFKVNVKWRKPFGGDTKVESSTIINGKNLTTPRNESSVFSEGQILRDGSQIIQIEVEDPDDTVDVTINVVHDDQLNKTCEVSFVPNFESIIPADTNSVSEIFWCIPESQLKLLSVRNEGDLIRTVKYLPNSLISWPLMPDNVRDPSSGFEASIQKASGTEGPNGERFEGFNVDFLLSSPEAIVNEFGYPPVASMRTAILFQDGVPMLSLPSFIFANGFVPERIPYPGKRGTQLVQCE